MYEGFWRDAVLVGVGATAVMDLIGVFRRRMFGVVGLDYRLVGRWLLWMFRGRFAHATIVQSQPMPYEHPVGWAVHYGIGVVFAALMLAIAGSDALGAGGPAVMTGVLSVAAPFLVMMPGFGFGVAAARTHAPWIARRRALVSHLSFALGLYLNGLLVNGL